MTFTQFGTFFLPGPTEVRPEILQALTGPMIPHRGRQFEELFARLEAGLRDVFLTARPVYIATASATGLMEAAIRNAPPGPILALANGAFSERFGKIARACARDVDVHAVPWGSAFDLPQVEDRLAARRYTAVTVAHSETSTGVLTDVHAVTELAHRHGAMCLVDSVTGLAGAELRFDEWQMDFVLTGSQKALALPPGLAFAVAQPPVIAAAATAPSRGVYLDLVELDAFARKRQTPNTPALSLLFAAQVQLRHIRAEGIEARWQRHAEMAADTWAWVERANGTVADGLRLFAPAGARSPTVTTIALPDGLDGETVVRATAARGFVIGAGYGKLKGSTIRIGHMGDHTRDGLARCLEAVADAMRAVRG